MILSKLSASNFGGFDASLAICSRFWLLRPCSDPARRRFDPMEMVPTGAAGYARSVSDDRCSLLSTEDPRSARGAELFRLWKFRNSYGQQCLLKNGSGEDAYIIIYYMPSISWSDDSLFYHPHSWTNLFEHENPRGFC